jgi:hypothetical protein
MVGIDFEKPIMPKTILATYTNYLYADTILRILQ